MNRYATDLHRPFALPAVALAIVSGAAFAGTPIYVDDDAPTGGDGSSWETAFTFLRDGIAAAAGASEIRIAGGRYTPDRTAQFPDGTGSRDATFSLRPGIPYRGGFAGLGAPDPDERDPVLYETVLTGDLLGDDGPGFADYDDNSLHVVTIEIPTVGDTTLDGVTVCGGHSDEDLSQGAGVNARSVFATTTIVDCTFRGNMCSGAGLSLGGAVFLRGGAHISGSVFDGNLAAHGGAIHAHHFKQELIEIEDCFFIRNNGLASGGAIDIARGFLRVRRSIFIDNAGTTSGGIGSSTPFQVDNSLFVGNVAGQLGGAIGAGDRATVRNCTFHLNVATGIGGGAIATPGGTTICNSILWGNTSVGGPDEILVDGTVDVGYSIVAGGWPGEGNIDEDPAFVNGPAGAWTEDATYDAELDRTTFVDAAATFDDSLFGRLLIPNTLLDTLRTSVVSNTATSITVPGNLAPIGFASAPYSLPDQQVATGSPAVDAGDNDRVPVGVDVDVTGNPRFVDDPETPDRGNGDPPVVDMGAYEFQAGGCIGDLDGSGAVDFGDILAILGAWGNKGGPEDLDGSRTVDFGDLLVVLGSWGPCK